MRRVTVGIVLVGLGILIGAFLLRPERAETPDPEPRTSGPVTPEPARETQADPTRPFPVHVREFGTDKALEGVRVTARATDMIQAFETDAEGTVLVPIRFFPRFSVEAALEGFSVLPPRFVDTRRISELTLGRVAQVSGTVLQPDGAPAPGAKVTLADFAKTGDFLPAGTSLNPAMHTTADEHGLFRFEKVNPGMKRVIARAKEFAPGWTDPFEVASGGKSQGVVVRLRRPAVVSVHVIAEGKNFEKATVEAGYTIPGVLDGDGGRNVVAAKKLGDGKYELSALPDRAVAQVRIRATGFRTHVEGPFEVTEGQARSFVVELQKGHSFSGRVHDLSGTPVSGAKVIVTQGDGQAVTGLTDKSGAFDVSGLSSRTLLLTVTKENHVTRRYSRLEPDTHGGDYALPRASVVTGTVSGTKGAAVYVCFSDGKARYRTRRDGDGVFRLESVPPGRVRIDVESESGERLGTIEIFLKEGEHRKGISLDL